MQSVNKHIRVTLIIKSHKYRGVMRRWACHYFLVLMACPALSVRVGDFGEITSRPRADNLSDNTNQRDLMWTGTKPSNHIKWLDANGLAKKSIRVALHMKRFYRNLCGPPYLIVSIVLQDNHGRWRSWGLVALCLCTGIPLWLRELLQDPVKLKCDGKETTILSEWHFEQNWKAKSSTSCTFKYDQWSRKGHQPKANFTGSPNTSEHTRTIRQHKTTMSKICGRHRIHWSSPQLADLASLCMPDRLLMRRVSWSTRWVWNGMAMTSTIFHYKVQISTATLGRCPHKRSWKLDLQASERKARCVTVRHGATGFTFGLWESCTISTMSIHVPPACLWQLSLRMNSPQGKLLNIRDSVGNPQGIPQFITVSIAI